jgi:BirA family biotin operon repressor/biotin-[acetyl-CoA-carboxylase] ligase
MVGVALHEAVRRLAPQSGATLKWPNDLMAPSGAGWAKLAGILLERHGEAVIAGAGVNVRAAPPLPDRATVALADLTGGEAVDAAALLDALADRFDAWLARWRAEGFAAVRAAWLAAAHAAGTPLTIQGESAGAMTGRFLSLAEDGALLIALEDGTQRRIMSGDVGFL